MSDVRNDLDWSAFCYLSGEMVAEDSAAFEELLASDQPAREALARAVELTQAVASAESAEPVTIAPAPSSVWTRRLSWMAIGAAASLLIAVLWTGFEVGPRMQAWLGQPQASVEQVQLAAAWNQTQLELSAVEFPSDLHGDAEGSDADDNETTDLDLSAVPEAPSWMTAAVFSLAGQPLPKEGLEN